MSSGKFQTWAKLNSDVPRINTREHFDLRENLVSGFHSLCKFVSSLNPEELLVILLLFAVIL